MQSVPGPRAFRGVFPLIKSQFVQRMATGYPHLSRRDIEKVVNAILGEITDSLARGERVELRGFGVFSTKQRPARTGRNPRNGDKVSVAKKRAAFFKTGKRTRGRLNRNPTRMSDHVDRISKSALPN
jgi:integration host factor subunit beta